MSVPTPTQTDETSILWALDFDPEIACEFSSHAGDLPATWLVVPSCANPNRCHECDVCVIKERTQVTKLGVVCKGCMRPALECWRFIPIGGIR